MDSLLSSLSPRLYGKELPFAIADATADFKKSICRDAEAIEKQIKQTLHQAMLKPLKAGYKLCGFREWGRESLVHAKMTKSL
jgi:hypothetical protein